MSVFAALCSIVYLYVTSQRSLNKKYTMKNYSMLSRHIALCTLLFLVSCTNNGNEEKLTSPYTDVALVTNTINWPYDDKTYGNDSFQLGDDENADTKILNLVQKNGFNFPSNRDDFDFGVAGSAYQYEGNRAAPSVSNPHGVGWSIWDVFTQKGSWLNPKETNIAQVAPTSVDTMPNGSVAINGFERYKADIEKVQQLGVKTYRLSLSWPRLFPRAGMKMEDVDKDGLAYYTAVLEEVKRQGLTPLITLYHWDLPAWLYNFGDPTITDESKKTYGWLDMRDAKDNLALLEFQKYAAVAYQHFGKYTSHFSTFNEPLTFTNVALLSGIQAPGQYGFNLLQKKDPELYGSNLDESLERIPYLQAINIIKAHDIAYKTIHAMYKNGDYRTAYQLQKPQVSIVLNSDWAEPFRIEGCESGHCKYNPDDIQASKNQMDYMLGWWLHPVMFGTWPQSMDKKIYTDRIRTAKQPQLGQFGDSSCLQDDGKPVACDGENTLKLSDDIHRGGTLDELAINHYTGYFVVDMNYAKNNFGTDPTKNIVPPDQYGSNPNALSRGWNSDQNAFTTQFRYLKYGDHGAAPAAPRAYVIGSAGAKPWLRQTWFVYRKLMQYINSTYLQSDPARETKSRTKFSDLGIYLTENGTSIYQESQINSLHDVNRVQYLVGNLGAIQQAKNEDKINIKLYTYWSLADNFEWSEGYDSRFGLLWIDYDTLAREPKQSYKCYQSIIKNNGSNQFPNRDCPLQ